MNKIIITGSECKSKLAKGIEKLYQAVGSTLGPGGRTVIIEDNFGGPPVITKDGVTVAKNINFADQYENLGVELVKQVASKTEELVGDGTTTATVLAYNIYNECNKFLDDNPSQIDTLRNSLKIAADKVVNLITRDTVTTVTSGDVYNIAMISSNGDEEISKLITDAFNSVGINGSINVDRSETVNTELKLSSGMEFSCGYCHPNFVTDNKLGVCILNNCTVFLSAVPIIYKEDILPVMQAAKKSNKSLLVLAPTIAGEALALLMSNKLNGTLISCAVNLPKFKDINQSLSDLSVITGAEIVNQNLSQDSNFCLGNINSVTISHDSMIVTNSYVSKEDINKYIESLKSEVLPTLKKYEIPGFELRIAKLSSGVATICVGGRTEADLKERRDRVDDAVLAVKSACDGGTVIGGGRELYQISEELDDSNLGESILKSTLKSPYRLMMTNAFLDPDSYNFDHNYGMDIRSKELCNLREKGILDPAKVTKSALLNAISIVNLLLSTNVVVINSELKKTPLSDKMYNL